MIKNYRITKDIKDIDEDIKRWAEKDLLTSV